MIIILLNLIKGFFPALLGLGIQLLMMIVSVFPINIRHWKVGYRTLAITI
jgi:hypothetical protein